MKGFGAARGGVAESRDGVVLRQPAQCAVLELADSLAREAEPAARLPQCLRLLAVQSEAQRDHVTLGVRKRVHGLAEALVLDAGHDLLLDGGAVARDQVAEGGVAVLADSLVEARRAAIGATDVSHLVER